MHPMNKKHVVVWEDGSYLYVDGPTWEYENDPDWLATIPLET